MSCVSAVGSLVDFFTPANDGSGYSLYVGDDTAVGQSWVSGASPAEITGVCFRLFTSGAPTGVIKAGIYAHSGVYGSSSIPTGAALVESIEYDASGVTSSGAWYFFPLSGWTPTAVTNYVSVLDGSGITAVSLGNSVRVVVDTAAEATHGGNASVENSGWGFSGGTDVGFRLYDASVSSQDGYGHFVKEAGPLGTVLSRFKGARSRWSKR